MIASILMFIACEDAAVSVEFTALSEGLKTEHQAEPPMLEWVSCEPQSTACQGSRVYADGALYLQTRQESGALFWSYLTQVKPEGISALKQTFNALCGVKTTPQRNANDQGSTTYRWQTEACAREVLITGVSFGDYALLQEISTLVNSNLVPRTTPQGAP